jgi:NADH:ubiquinone oxidoreductase subunit C
MKDISTCQKLIKEAIGNEIQKIEQNYGYLYIHIDQKNVLKCLSILSSSDNTSFCALTDCFGVKKDESILIYYQLHSYKLGITIFAVTKTPNNYQFQSLTALFENANWYEKEILQLAT